MKEKHIVIQDQIGRTIMGVVASEDSNTISINNPVIIHVQPEPSGQLQVQTFPLFFFEFINKESREKNIWTYTKSNIAIADVELDERIVSQYQKINTPQDAPSQNSPKVISINDL
jgi:hypothetical protein